jgi:hypothetical protein
MLNCTNGHEQPEDAKFCGICGSVMKPSAESSGDELAEWAEPTAEAIELDLMSDDTDTDDDTDARAIA